MIKILNTIHVIIRPAKDSIFPHLARRLEKLPTLVLCVDENTEVVWTGDEERQRVCRKKVDKNGVTRKEEKKETKKKIFKSSERRYAGSWCEGDRR